MSYLNDDEHRILLAALRREKEFCSRQLTDPKRCVAVVQSLERKFQYGRFEEEIRDKAIDDFVDKTKSFVDLGHLCSPTELRWTDLSVCKMIDKIAEQMKEVGE